jgi:hypothetical protein
MWLELFYQTCGWLGATSFLLSYFLLLQEKIKPLSYAYCGMNIAGSLLFVINLIPAGAYGPAFSNTIWAIIGTHGLYKVYANRKTIKN